MKDILDIEPSVLEIESASFVATYAVNEIPTNDSNWIAGQAYAHILETMPKQEWGSLILNVNKSIRGKSINDINQYLSDLKLMHHTANFDELDGYSKGNLITILGLGLNKGWYHGNIAPFLLGAIPSLGEEDDFFENSRNIDPDVSRLVISGLKSIEGDIVSILLSNHFVSIDRTLNRISKLDQDRLNVLVRKLVWEKSSR